MAKEALPKYNESLRADVQTQISDSPVAKVHRVEWQKVMSGEPVEINPSVGQGYRVMSVDEWAARWKRNDDFPQCLKCEGTNTKEHYFTQTWCRGRKKWQSELLCLDCLHFSYRAYSDPDFMSPEEHQKQYWTSMAVAHDN